MAQPVSTQQKCPRYRRRAAGLRRRSSWVSAALAAMALLGALALWFRYGTTVFFEMIATGISACF